MVSNTELYDRWAQTYDTDGNILQAIDDQEIPDLLTGLFERLNSGDAKSLQTKFKVTELGCGTGRNTSKLLQAPFCDSISEIYGLELSAKMLDIACQRCAMTETDIKVSLHIYNAIENSAPPFEVYNSDIVISTLVLEHIPIKTFFASIAKMLKRDGYLLLTGMHAGMGLLSRAGFRDENSGEKVRGESFVFENEEVVKEAEEAGFQLVGTVKERTVVEDDVNELGARAQKWIGCTVWFGCVFMKVSV